MNKLLILLATALLAFPTWAGQTKNAEPVWSSAFERFLAPHWVAATGDVDLGRRFLIACDPEQGVYLRSLRELGDLRAEYRKDPRAWAQSRYWHYTCIERNSLRVLGPTNLPLSKPAEPDEEGINEGYYRVVREDVNSQLIELHYRDRNTDIYDSFYKYEVRGDQVIPLESWVWGRGNFQLLLFAAFAIIVLLFVIAVTYKLVRILVRRKARTSQQSSDH